MMRVLFIEGLAVMALWFIWTALKEMAYAGSTDK